MLSQNLFVAGLVSSVISGRFTTRFLKGISKHIVRKIPRIRRFIPPLVAESSLRRFEETGNVSLESLLKIIYALGRLYEINELLNPPVAESTDDHKNNTTIPKKGNYLKELK